AGVDDIGLEHGMAQRLLGDVQRAVAALQEAALKAEADRLRRLDPTLQLKDYRLRRIQGKPPPKTADFDRDCGISFEDHCGYGYARSQ
ncbi:MAG: hypothetical protein RLO48_15610, partial [Bauldia litoralis]